MIKPAAPREFPPYPTYDGNVITYLRAAAAYYRLNPNAAEVLTKACDDIEAFVLAFEAAMTDDPTDTEVSHHD